MRVLKHRCLSCPSEASLCVILSEPAIELKHLVAIVWKQRACEVQSLEMNQNEKSWIRGQKADSLESCFAHG